MRGRGSKLAKANKHPLNQLCREKMEEAGEGVNGGAQYHHQAIALTLYDSEEMWDYSLLEEKFAHMERYGDPLESLKDMLDAGPSIDNESTLEEISETLMESWVSKLQEEGSWSPMEDSRLTIRG
tara:strand:+ start:3223 stop:3597 length:375 start_codon:yes stop_codon:yes gene_type:complete